MQRVLGFLRKRALWIYGIGAAVALCYGLVVIFLWPSEAADSGVLLLPVLLTEWLPLVWLAGVPIIAGILLYGQYHRNGLRSFLLGSITVLWVLVLLVLSGGRLRVLNLYYANELWADSRPYVLTAHQMPTRHCNEETCFEFHTLYECDTLALSCNVVLDELRGGAGEMKLDVEDGTLYVFDSYEGLTVGEHPIMDTTNTENISDAGTD